MPTTHYPWLYEIFPLADENYTLRDIWERLRQFHTPTISRSSVYRAHKALKKSVATRSEVRALNEDAGEKCLEFDADAARLIARKVTRNRPPVSKPRSR